jgi:DNA-binding protein Fis
VKDQLESLVGMMVDRGILLEEAVTEFEKKFIKRVLERLNGNQSRAAKILGIHRNTLSRKVGEYSEKQKRPAPHGVGFFIWRNVL